MDGHAGVPRGLRILGLPAAHHNQSGCIIASQGLPQATHNNLTTHASEISILRKWVAHEIQGS